MIFISQLLIAEQNFPTHVTRPEPRRVRWQFTPVIFRRKRLPARWYHSLWFQAACIVSCRVTWTDYMQPAEHGWSTWPTVCVNCVNIYITWHYRLMDCQCGWKQRPQE